MRPEGFLIDPFHFSHGFYRWGLLVRQQSLTSDRHAGERTSYDRRQRLEGLAQRHGAALVFTDEQLNRPGMSGDSLCCELCWLQGFWL